MRIGGIVIALIFGLAFGGGGGFFLFETSIPYYRDWQAMKAWQPANAHLLSITRPGNRTEASYRYEVAGVDYQNDRVFVADFSDNIGSYQSEIYERLNQLQRRKQPVPIWVNPTDPQDSVIDRDMRWGLFALMTAFCSFFILFGLGVVYGSLRSAKKTDYKPPSTTELRREWEQKKQNDPDFKEDFIEYRRYRLHELENAVVQKDIVPVDPEAWRERKGWQTDHIRSDAKSSITGMWFFAIIWNAISSPVLFFFEEEWSKGNFGILIALLFPLVGIILLYKAISMTREFRRFGIIEFVMDPYPGGIGGNVGGSLQIEGLNEYDAEYRIELECVYSYMSGSGDDRRRYENIRWAEAGNAQVDSMGMGVRLSFRFDIPDNLPEADIEQKESYTFWRLKVKAEIPGVDLDRTYNIPVYNTGERSRYVSRDLSAQALEVRESEAEESQAAISRGDFHLTELSRSLRFSETQQQARLYFPMFRNKVLTVFSLIFAGGFDFATYSILSGFGSSGGAFGILAVIFAIPFGLIGLLATIAAIYLPFNNLTVTIGNGQVKILRRLFFIPVLIKRINNHEVHRLSVKSSGSTGQGTKMISHYKVTAHYGVGKTATIAEDIDGVDLANQFKDYLFTRIQSSQQEYY